MDKSLEQFIKDEAEKRYSKRYKNNSFRRASFSEGATFMHTYLSSQHEQEIKELKERISDLSSVCLAAAEEIQSKWQSHCDEEGYGPSNLMSRLEQKIGGYYPGYNAGQFTKLESQIKSLTESHEKEIAELKGENERLK